MATTDETNPYEALLAKLEPEAVKGSSVNAMFETSIAISLKRIADMLHKMAPDDR